LPVIRESWGRAQHSIIDSDRKHADSRAGAAVNHNGHQSTSSSSLKDNLKAAKAGSEHPLSATGADELMMLTDTRDGRDRRESCRLVAAPGERIKFRENAVAQESTFQ
jgi:hypothetical protein